MSPPCPHVVQVRSVELHTTAGCEDCRRIGSPWVHLRLRLTCGHVGCCDSSVGKHATAHFHDSLHPVVESAERDESWRWCYVHNLTG